MSQFVTHGPPILFAPLGAVFVILSLALGRRVLILLGASGGSLAERGTAAFALGAGFLQFVPFALGVIGVLSPTAIIAVLTALGVALFSDVRSTVRSVPKLVDGLRSAPTWIKLWGVALLPALVLASFVALTPTIDSDGLSYHLTAPKRWLQQGSLAYLPTYPYTNAPMGAEMLFAIGLATGGDTLSKLFHFLLGATGVVGLYAAGKRFRGPVVGVAAATLYLVAPRSVAPLLGWAYVEGAAAFAMIASVSAWFIWYETRQAGWLRASFLLAGLAVTVKMTAILFPIVMGALTVWCLWNSTAETKLTAALWRVVRLIPLVALPVLPWLTRAFVLTGNPFFPVLANLIPSRDYTPEQAAQFETYNRYMVWAGESGDSLSLAQRKLIVASVALALVVVALLSFLRVRSKLGRGTVLILLGGTLLQLFAAGLYVRYWLPVLSVLYLPLCAWLEPVVLGQSRRLAMVGLTGLLSCYQGRAISSGLSHDLVGGLRVIVGLEDEHAFRMRHLPLTSLYDLVNARLPQQAGVLLSTYCGGFHIDRTTYCAEFVQSSLRYDSWQVFLEDARKLRISHVIAPRVLAEGGAPPIGVGNAAVLIRANEFARLQQLLGQHGRLLASSLDQGLYAVELPE